MNFVQCMIFAGVHTVYGYPSMRLQTTKRYDSL